MSYYSTIKIEEMVGKTFIKVFQTEDELVFENSEGRYVFYHIQDCCESVTIEEVIGDLSDLEGSLLLRAEEEEGASGPEPKGYESYTWTFYKFATIKGEVVVRWLGESNGYYSESVDLRFEPTK